MVMFNNIGLNTKIFTPVTLVLLVLGAVLGYGGKFILTKIYKNPSDKAVLTVKLIGLALVLAGVIIIFRQ
jgi:hypothetical protein